MPANDGQAGKRQKAPDGLGTIGFAVVSMIFALFTLFLILAFPVGHHDVLVGAGLYAALSLVVIWCVASIWLRRITAARGRTPRPTLGMILAAYALFVFAFGLAPGGASERECARRAACKNNLKQLGYALHIYAADHGQRFPEKLSELYPTYERDLEVFVCPSTKDVVSSPDEIDRNTSYGYIGGLTYEDRYERPQAYDKPGNHQRYRIGGNILYLDGHVAWVWEDTLEEIASEENRTKATSQGTDETSH